MSRKIAILEINGGIGKSIMASAVCEAIKKQYPDRELIVFTAWVEPLLNNPNISRVYKTGITQYIYQDIIVGNDVLFLCEEPYRSKGYLLESKHLIESWCETINVKYNGETPSVYLTPLEREIFAAKYARSKPIMVIHPFGGASNSHNDYSWNRDIPYAQAQSLVGMFADRYHIFQIGNQDQPKLNGVEFPVLTIREALCLLKASKARILIDSFSNHACAAMNLPSTVCWITNKPLVFGYKIHKNIEANWENTTSKIHNIDGYLSNWDFSGSRMYDYPFTDGNVFNINAISNAVMEQEKVASK